MLASGAALGVLAVWTASLAGWQPPLPLLPSRSIAATALAPASESPAQQMAALTRWTRDYWIWQAWYARWGNRHEPRGFGPRERRQAPEPPPWLPSACSALMEDSGPLIDGCRAWRDWRRTSGGSEGAGGAPGIYLALLGSH